MAASAGSMHRTALEVRPVGRTNRQNPGAGGRVDAPERQMLSTSYPQTPYIDCSDSSLSDHKRIVRSRDLTTISSIPIVTQSEPPPSHVDIGAVQVASSFDTWSRHL